MPYIGDYTDLRSLIPFIADEVRTSCYATIQILYESPDFIRICTARNCIRLYWEWGRYVYLVDEYSGSKTDVTSYPLYYGIRHIAALLCR